MSLSRRLFNLARSELRSVLRNLQTPGDRRAEDDWAYRQVEAELADAQRRASEKTSVPINNREPPDIARYYANLELHIGASEAEVRAAYRRLMRRYHPDRHNDDPQKARVANELAHQLRVAHDGLLAYLSARR